MLRAPRMLQGGLVAAAGLARSFYHLLDRHRVDEAAGFLDDDFRGHGMGSDRAGFRAETAAWLAAFPDLRIAIDRLVTDGASVAARLVLSGTHEGRFAGLSPTGRPIDIAGVDVLIEHAGRFVEAWSLRDLNGLWVQLGALPGPDYPSQRQEHHMSNPTTAVATRFYELFSNGQIDGVIGLLGDDYLSHGFGGGGPENLRQSLQGMRSAFPDLTFTVEDTITEADKVAVKTTMRGTHRGPFAGRPASGSSIEVGGCDVFRVQDGRIVEAWWLGDSGSLLRQIGAIPAPTPS